MKALRMHRTAGGRGRYQVVMGRGYLAGHVTLVNNRWRADSLDLPGRKAFLETRREAAQAVAAATTATLGEAREIALDARHQAGPSSVSNQPVHPGSRRAKSTPCAPCSN